MNQPSLVSLTPAGVLGDIAAAITRHGRSLLLVSVPMILLGAWTVFVHLSLKIDLWDTLEGAHWLWTLLDGLLYLLISTMWIVSIARIVLLNDAGRTRWLGVRWQRREWWVLLESILVAFASVLLLIPFGAALLILSSLAGWDISTSGADPTLGYWSNLAMSLLASAITSVGVGRWGFAIVAAAVDSNVRMGESWRVTAGSTVAIAGMLFLLLIPSTALQTFIDLRLAGSSPGLRIVLIVGVPVCMVWFFGIQALVLCAAFRRLAPYLRQFDGQPHPAAQTFPL